MKLTEESLVDWMHDFVSEDCGEVLRTDILIDRIKTDETGQQILENQEIVERLKEYLKDPLNNPEMHGIVFHNPEYATFLKEILGGKE